ncbi:hypothetical protein KIM372_01300 [Bombiscardovia nodaiensis]|uniref:Antitoxin SocA-like Panacea domain-containing protein n=1 Tax=Bombiscardovia nodaiensis TaxID=2932181 RepID=A0ABN6S9Z3_9BIFI|nr:hypothetical protein KIM372_01300 [Bombiscardovia nodaiensis]
MSTTTTSLDIAAWLIWLANEEGKDMSVLPLQKMVTLAQSLFGYTTHTKLYNENIYAFEYGPVTQGVLTCYGGSKEPIVRPRTEVKALPDEQLGAIASIWDLCSPLKPSQLVDVTHDVGPWKPYRNPNNNFTVIPWNEFVAAWPEYERAAQSYNSVSNAHVDRTSSNIEIPESMLGDFDQQIFLAQQNAYSQAPRR